jgi:hypothetical protein
MELADAYAAAFALLAGWGAFTASALARAPRPWSALRRYSFLTNLLFVTSSVLCTVALGGRRFAAWMLLPFGLSYAAMIPMPCYFDLVNRIGWVHTLRNGVFALVAATCAALGLGVIPLSQFGL